MRMIWGMEMKKTQKTQAGYNSLIDPGKFPGFLCFICVEKIFSSEGKFTT
jgi:hypothetical protein